MCTVSNKIKFCTCAATAPEKLRHYWIWHRFVKGKEEHCLGEPRFPDELFVADYKTNQKILQQRLNEPDAFDFETDFRTKDQLVISINHEGTNHQNAIYCFKFSQGKWKAVEYDVFDLMNHYDELAFGKLRV